MGGRIQRPEIENRTILPRIGFIKTGMKTDKGVKSLDYFICDSLYKRYFDEVYKNPSTIQIAFFDDDPETSCMEEYTLHDKDGKKYASGDGENFYVWNGKVYQKILKSEYPNLMESVEKRAQSRKGWEVQLTLRFILPAIRNIIGHWQYSTKGLATSIPNIRDTFDMTLEKRGSVCGILFDLNVSFQKSQKPGVKSRYPVVQLVPNQMEDNVKIIKSGLSQMTIENKKLGLDK